MQMKNKKTLLEKNNFANKNKWLSVSLLSFQSLNKDLFFLSLPFPGLTFNSLVLSMSHREPIYSPPPKSKLLPFLYLLSQFWGKRISNFSCQRGRKIPGSSSFSTSIQFLSKSCWSISVIISQICLLPIFIWQGPTYDLHTCSICLIVCLPAPLMFS